jgi:hypothetical protein
MDSVSLALSIRVKLSLYALSRRASMPLTVKDLERMLEEVNENTRLQDLTRQIAEDMRKELLTLCSGLISKSILYGIRETLRSELGYDNIRFIPFGKSLLVLSIESASREPFSRPISLREFVEDSFPSIIASYVYWTSKGRKALLEGKLSNEQRELLKVAEPLLEGKLQPDVAGRLLYEDWRSSRVELHLSSALAEEVSGLILPLLSAEGGSIILLEEPEAQLHPGAQIIMGLFLASLPKLCNCKVVVSTHSDLLAITLSQLAVQRPNKKWVENLIERILPYVKQAGLREGVEALADKAAEASKELDLRVYEYLREGKIRSVKPEEVLGKEVPGISKVIDELTDWAFELAIRNKGE